MRRFLAFMFGVIFGMVFLLGSVGIAMYASVTVVHPNDIYADIETYLGDLGDVSLLQAYYNILDLYNDKTGNISNEKLYSVGDFLADNHISTTTEEGKTIAFGIEMPDELLDAPLFEYFNTNVDENGNTGVQRALMQIKLSAVPAVVNTFATTDESGNTVVSEDIVAKLDEHSVYDLVYGGEPLEDGSPDIVGNLAIVLDDITLADLIPSFREGDQSENQIKNLLFALGQSPIGPIITDLTGDGNILGMLGDDGSLSAVGKLTVADIVGDSDPLINSLLGHIAICDLINENGELVIVDALDKVSIAGLLGIVKRPIDISILSTNITSFYERKDDGTNGAYIFSVGQVDDKLYISVNAENDSVATTWYEGQVVCAETHMHTDTCYDYVWYAPCKEGHAHADEYTITTGESTTAYIPVATTSVNYTLTKLRLSQLFDETGAINLNNLLSQFDKHSVGQILEELLAHNDVLDKLSALLKLDGITITDLLAEGGLDNLLVSLKSAPLVELLDAFGVTELGLLGDIVGDMSINELIEGGYNNITLGTILGYTRFEVTAVDNSTIVTHTDTEGNIVGYTAKVDEQIVISVDGESWYYGKLACSESHDHGFDCYENLWYTKCADGCTESHDHVTIDQENHTPASGIFALLVDLSIGDITTNPESLLDKVFDIKLKELLGEELDGLLAKIGEYSIRDLMNPDTLNDLGIADILNYIRKDVTADVSTEWTDVISNNGTVVVKHNSATDAYAYLDESDSKWYNAQLVCKKDSHAHDIDCYGYVWYAECTASACTDHSEHFTADSTTYGRVSGIFEVLADLTIGSLTGGEDIMSNIINRLTIGDIFGNNLPEMLSSLKDTVIADLDSAIETTKVGDLLGYDYNETQSRWEKEGTPLTGIEKVLADKSIADLKDFESILDEVTLGDVLNPVPEMLESLADVKISQLGSKLETMKVGDLLGYDYNETEARWEKEGAPLTGIEKVIADKTIADLKDFNSILDDVKLGDILDPIPDMLASIADTPISQLSTAIDNIYVGEFLGYTKGSADGTTTLDCEESHPHTEDCYYANYNWLDGSTAVSGMMAKLANKKVGNLGSIGDEITTYTIAELMGTSESDSALVKALYNTPVGEIGTQMNTIQLGTAMGYYRNEVSDGVYETDANGKVVWYTDDTLTTKVGAPQSAFVNSTLNNIGSDINNITLGEIVEMDNDSSPMLKALKDTPLNGIATAIDGMALGTAMGFVRHEVVIGSYPIEVVDGVKATTDDYTTAQCAKLDGVIWYDATLECKDSTCTHTADCFGYIWYEKCADGCTESHDHVTIDEVNYTPVTGLNAKMSNLTVDNMGGTAIVDIVTDLTMKEMIDSGILTFTEEEMFKLAVLFGCDESTHTTTLASQTFACNLSGYYSYNALCTTIGYSTVDVEQFYKLTHNITGDLTDEQIAHRDEWQDCTLTEFISALLAGI